jgi:Protein of unknown function (DUF2778)
MQGIDATFGDISFGRDHSPGPDIPPIIPAAVALALAGSVAICAWVLHTRTAAAPDFGNAPLARSVPAPKAAPATGAAAKPYGEIVIDPSFLAEMKPASPGESPSPLASLDNAPAMPPAAFPLPSLDAFPPEPSAGVPQAETVLPPQKPDTLDIDESAPLPPPRPPEFAMPATPGHLAQPNVATVRPAAPADNRNFLQKLFGLGLPPTPAAASRPAVASAPAAPSGPAVLSRPASTSGVAVASAAPESRGAGRALLGAPFGASAPGAGLDRYTAVYDISARTVYLPDGTRLEAHSGLGDRLDNPRYVSERMYGPTPPHVYELALREGSFHGVQALRLNPIGEGDLYGRAGLLAHPYMLGPNGDSNGCLSVKDYQAFLRAYENGEIKRLVVVAQL